jgi:(E)-4-hydroxy-3-methylbut-2-enyl-diphosphate synthase
MAVVIQRKITRRIHVGQVPIGDGAPIAVQSMTNTDTRDVSKTVDQITRLARSGCEIVRLAIPDNAAATAFKAIKSQVTVPLIADIHP